MKPLKKILKTAEPYDKDSVSKGDQDFINKHKIEKTEDANGNDDDHFTAAHVKTSERKPRHGYTDDEDNGMYEETQLDEISKKTLGSYIKKSADDYGTLSDRITRIEQEPDWKSNKEKYKKWTKLVNKYNNRSYGIDKAVDRLTKEEAQLDEAKGDRLKANHEDALADMAGAIANARDAGENNKLGRLLKKRDFHRQALRNLKKKYPEKMDEETEQLDEVLKASDPAAKWITHFVDSDDPKFEGKSKKQRIQIALAARYAAKRGD